MRVGREPRRSTRSPPARAGASTTRTTDRRARAEHVDTEAAARRADNAVVRKTSTAVPNAASHHVVLGSDAAVYAAVGKLEVSAQAGALVRLGYDAGVARRIADSYPGLARRIIELADAGARVGRTAANGRRLYYTGCKAWEPVTVYRGISEERFDPRFVGDHGGRVSLTEDLGTAVSYGFGWVAERQEHALVLEMQVPRFLCGVKAESGPKDHPVLYVSDLPDHGPLVRRVGLLPFTAAVRRASDAGDTRYLAAPQRVRWVAAKQIDAYVERED